MELFERADLCHFAHNQCTYSTLGLVDARKLKQLGAPTQKMLAQGIHSATLVKVLATRQLTVRRTQLKRHLTSHEDQLDVAPHK